MKRILALAVLFLFILQGFVLAAPVTIIDPAGQSQVRVKNEALASTDKARAMKTIVGSGLVYAGACNVLSINMYSDTTGDNITVYDLIANPSNQYQLEFEIGIAANTSSTSIDTKGAPFVNGIYIFASDATNAVTTIIFDY